MKKYFFIMSLVILAEAWAVDALDSKNQIIKIGGIAETKISEMKFGESTVGRSKKSAKTISITREGKAETVWRADLNPKLSLLPYKPVRGSIYDEAEVVLASSDSNGDRLVILFELRWDTTDPRTYRKSGGIDWSQIRPAQVSKNWNGKIPFLRTFTRNKEGEWQVEVSAFTDTIWESVRGEKPVKLSIDASGACEITYRKKWRIEIHPDGRPHLYNKIVDDPEGTTTKKLFVNRDTGLLLTAGDDLKEIYVNDSYWWLDVDLWDLDKTRGDEDRVSSIFERQGAADKAKIPSRNNASL